MTRAVPWVLLLLVLVVGGALRASGAMSRGDEKGPPPKKMRPAHAGARAAARKGDCEETLRLVRNALALDPTDAEAFNLRGYCLRKTGDLEGAFRAYGQALKLRPDFPEARAYLAEAHIDAALEQVKVLHGYGGAGAEDLVDVTQALRRAASSAGALAGAGAKPRGGW